MSAKPFTAGHDSIIQMAASECDEVLVFVSLADRRRPGEFPIMGTDMATIWRELVEPGLPTNVTIEYASNPMARIWATLGAANESGSPDSFAIYGDERDTAARFGPAALAKYASGLQASGRISFRTPPRITSGTEMRKALADGDLDAFRAGMPAWLDADRAWQVLRAHRTNEELLRSFVRRSIARA